MALKILHLVMITTIITLASAEPISRLFNHSINSIDKRTFHVKRVIPAVNGCHPGDIWLGRECDGDIDPQGWVDLCESQENDPEGNPILYNPPGECPENTQCQEFDDEDGDPSINCVPIPADSNPTSDTTVESKPPAQNPQQHGKRKFAESGTSGAKKQRIASVQVQENIPHASVSAHLMSSDYKFEILPSKALVGNLRGKNDIRCKQYLSKTSHRQCSPVIGRESLKKGDWIDFTFETLDYQSGFLMYFIKGLSA